MVLKHDFILKTSKAAKIKGIGMVQSVIMLQRWINFY